MYESCTTIASNFYVPLEKLLIPLLAACDFHNRRSDEANFDIDTVAASTNKAHAGTASGKVGIQVYF